MLRAGRQDSPQKSGWRFQGFASRGGSFFFGSFLGSTVVAAPGELGLGVWDCRRAMSEIIPEPEFASVPLQSTHEPRPRRVADDGLAGNPDLRAARLRPGISAGNGAGMGVFVHGVRAST